VGGDKDVVGRLIVASPIPRTTNHPLKGLGQVKWTIQISCADWYMGVLMHASYFTPKGMCDVSRDLLKFRQTSDNISSTAKADIVAMEN